MLSNRAAAFGQTGFAHGKKHLYHPIDRPDGEVNFANAENWLVHDELTKYINSHNTFSSMCTSYNEGFTGNYRLRSAMAGHINTHFNPAQPIDHEDLTFAAGVTDLNEVCAFLFCDHGKKDAIMLGRPIYGSFKPDLALRTGVDLEYVPFPSGDQFSQRCVSTYEAALVTAKARGVNVRALLICNPHNPLGRCYSRLALVGLLKLCDRHKIHLISDEIYALSTYDREGRESEKFTSVLSIGLKGLIGREYVHVLYGMSKDFGAAGMRLGCVVSWNEAFKKATRAICRFSSPSEYSQAIAASILENQNWVKGFLAKSQKLLLKNRLLAESLLDNAGIEYYDEGNAGFFLWIDLSPWLPLSETDGDAWAAEKLLSKRLDKRNLGMAYGGGFQATEPGRFRLVCGVDEDTLREGIRRIKSEIDNHGDVEPSSVELSYET